MLLFQLSVSDYSTALGSLVPLLSAVSAGTSTAKEFTSLIDLVFLLIGTAFYKVATDLDV